MSTTFYGRTADGRVITLDVEDPTHLNMSSANARAFLGFLGLDPGADLSGEATLPEIRRGIIRARATFDRRVRGYTREASDTKRPGRVRVVECGLDDDYFKIRLDAFERFLGVVAGRAAATICWS